MRRISTAALFAVVLSLAVGAGTSVAHEGHDHGGAPAEVAASVAPRASSTSENFEVVVVARKDVLTIYVDRFATNEPITNASVDVQSPAGEARAEPQPDGTYRLAAPWSSKPGDHELVLAVSAGGITDAFPVELYIPEQPAGGQATAHASGLIGSAFARGLADNFAHSETVLIGTAGGFIAGLLVMAFARSRRRRPELIVVLALIALAPMGGKALAHEGHDHGAEKQTSVAAGSRDQAKRTPDGAVFMPKSTQRILGVRTVVTEATGHQRSVELPGRVIGDPNATGFVQAATGGRLSAPQGGFPRLGTPVKQGDVLAYVTPSIQTIDVSDMRQRQGELDQQISIVERRLSRIEPLAKSGAVAQAQLDEARLELQGLKDRRNALDRIRRDAEPLIAPIDGVIAEATVASGMMTQPSQVVFQIIDPLRLWVEALSFEVAGELPKASARLSSGRTLALVYQGSGLADRNQAVPVQFRIDGDTRGLRVGQFVTVYASGDDQIAGLALPRTSVVRGNAGQNLIYEHTAPEQFEPREVRVEPLDGERVIIPAGIEAGKRIVTSGAELLNQVR